MSDGKETQGLKPWEIAALDDPQPQSSGLDDYESSQKLREFLQGITYNTADEAEAAIVSQLTDRPYPEVISEIRTKLGNYEMTNKGEAALMQLLGGIVPTAAAMVFTKGRGKAPAGTVTAENAAAVGNQFFPNLMKAIGYGTGETVVAGIGAAEGNLIDRLDPMRMTGEGLVGGGVSGGLYAGGNATLKVGSFAVDVIRTLARRVDQDKINLELRRIMEQSEVSAERAAEMLVNGEALANDPAIAEELAGLAVKSPQAATRIRQAAPRIEEAQEEAFETVAGGLGGGMKKNTLDIARSSDADLNKSVNEAYAPAKKADVEASPDLIDSMSLAFQKAPQGARKFQDAFRSLTGTAFFRVTDDGVVEFAKTPTVMDAEYLRRILDEEGSKLIESGGADANIGRNLKEAAEEIRAYVDDELPLAAEARSIAANRFSINDAYKAGKKVKTAEEAQQEFQDLLAEGNTDAIDAYRLGYLVQLKSRMTGNKTTVVNNLLDPTKKEGILFNTIVPPHAQEDALKKLGIAQRTQRSMATMAGGSPTARRTGAANRVGSTQGIARVITDLGAAKGGNPNALANTLDGIIRTFQPNITDSQAGRVAEILLSRDPDIVSKALRDKTVLRSVQDVIESVSRAPLRAVSQSAGRTAAI